MCSNQKKNKVYSHTKAPVRRYFSDYAPKQKCWMQTKCRDIFAVLRFSPLLVQKLDDITLIIVTTVAKSVNYRKMAHLISLYMWSFHWFHCFKYIIIGESQKNNFTMILLKLHNNIQWWKVSKDIYTSIVKIRGTYTWSICILTLYFCSTAPRMLILYFLSDKLKE